MNDLKKLRWRCRRGTLELDIILLRYLDQRFSLAGQAEQQAFLRLLDLEDSDLIRYVLGEQTPGPDLLAVVTALRALPSA